MLDESFIEECEKELESEFKSLDEICNKLKLN